MATLGNTPRPAYVYDTETDTWVPIGVGAHTHDTLYVNQNIIDAKGDLIVGTSDNSYDRLAAGNSGDTLLADSSQTTGLRWGDNLGYTAGKNKIINGDFKINQRAFTSTTADSTYGFDRWKVFFADGTNTYSAQAFTAGTAPVAGYEGTNFARMVSTGQTLASAGTWLRQSIEDVRTFANQTVTISFWAKAASGTPKLAVELDQQFGTGGSTRVTTYGGQVTLSTSWARYSLTVAVPSISGKTIGTDSMLILNIMASAGSNFNARSGSLGIQSNTFDFWGVQVEAGSVATAFQTATGTLAGELAACQRYYFRAYANSAYQRFSAGVAQSTTSVYTLMDLPVEMRIIPSAIDYPTVSSNFCVWDGVTTTNCTGLGIDANSKNVIGITGTVSSGLTQYRYYQIMAQGSSSSAYIGVSAEL